VRERRSRMLEQNARIALVGQMVAACEVNDDCASKREQQKCGIYVPSSSQRTADHAAPALAVARPIVGQGAGHA
jgi:hypothetical protein